MRHLIALLAVPVLGVMLAAGTPKAAAPAPESGDAAFARKDFKKALELYRVELQKAPEPSKERRVVSCLAALGEWDEALREGEALVLKRGESLEGVRARRLLADLYRNADHQGFKVGGEIRRGSENREGESVWLFGED